MLRLIAAPGFLLALTSLALTQTTQTKEAALEFEVASIKPFVMPQPGAGRGVAMTKRGRGGPGSSDPGQISWNGATLKTLLMNAYGVKNYQITGPPWLDTERFNIVAKVPPGTTKEQVLIMWQNLLAERFQLKLHRETREIPVYELVVGKNGPKMKESGPAPELPKDPAPRSADGPPPPFVRPAMGPDGCPVFPPGGRGGTSMMTMPGRFRMCALRTTMEGLVNMLMGQLDRPIFDKTGLKAEYDFRFEFQPEGPMGMMMGPAGGGMVPSASQAGGTPTPAPEGGLGSPGNQDPAPPIATAFQSQLGLKLEAKKAPADMLIIDKIEKTPTEN
jgi:uncharacterized protein (TIGR03435 family)